MSLSFRNSFFGFQYLDLASTSIFQVYSILVFCFALENRDRWRELFEIIGKQIDTRTLAGKQNKTKQKEIMKLSQLRLL